MPTDFLNKNKDIFEQISFILEQRNKSAVLVFDIPNYKIDEIAKKQLAEILPKYNYIDIDLAGQDFGSLTNFLKENLPKQVFENENIKHVVNIFNLQNHALQMKKNEKKEIVFVASEIIEQINFERERIFREIPAIIILYIDNYTVEKLQQTAPDFWDWINYYFKFENPEIFAEDFVQDEDYKPEPHYTPERKKKIEELEQKLNTLDKNSLSEERFFKSQINLQIAIAKELREVRKFSKAIKHLENALTTIEKYKILEELKSDVLKYIVYNNTSLRKFETALKINEKYFEWAKNNKSKIGNYYYRKGYIYYEQKNWSKALENYEKCIESGKKTNNLSEIGNVYGSIGNVYYKQKNWNKTLENYEKSIEWNEKNNNLLEIGEIYNNIGLVYDKQKNWNKALENYEKSIEWYEKTNNLSEIGGTYNNIASFYYEQKNWDKALENFEKSIEKLEKTNNLFEVSKIFENLKLLLPEIYNNYNKTIKYYRKQLKKYEKAGIFRLHGFFYTEIALLRREQDKEKKAFSNFKKALESKNKYKIEIGNDRIYFHLASFYDYRNEDEKAFEYYTKALELKLKYAIYKEADIDVTIKWLEQSLDECNNKSLKKQAEDLLKIATTRNL